MRVSHFYLLSITVLDVPPTRTKCAPITRTILDSLEPGVLVPAGFLHAHEGVGFGIGGSVTVDRARNALIGSTNQWSWGGAANTYMNIDHTEGLAFILFTQVTPSFELCQWRRDLTNLIQACLIDSPQSGL